MINSGVSQRQAVSQGVRELPCTKKDGQSDYVFFSTDLLAFIITQLVIFNYVAVKTALLYKTKLSSSVLILNQSSQGE